MEAAPVPAISLFERAPLVTRISLPTYAVQSRIVPAIPGDLAPETLEAAVLASSMQPKSPEAGRVLDALAGFETVPASPAGFRGALGVARARAAAWRLRNDRADLEAVSRFFAWIAEHYDELLRKSDLRDGAADLIELAVGFYRYTGASGCLKLLERLRRDCTDWSVRLRTFDQTRPTSAEGGYSAVGVADALRGLLFLSEYSGNRTEAETAEMAWPRIKRWHGAVCGGTSGAPRLGGLSPSAPVSAGTVGAWAETMAAFAADGAAWAVDEAERLLLNAVPMALREGTFAVNQPHGKAHPDRDAADDARLLRGLTALLSAAVLRLPDGLRVNYAAPVVCGMAVNGKRVTVQTEAREHGLSVRVEPEAPVSMKAEIRVPRWLEDAVLTVNGEKQPCAAGGIAVLRREWKRGGLITLTGSPSLRVEPAYHQGRCVYSGAVLMAVDTAGGADWAFALEDASRGGSGEVKAALRPVGGWKVSGDGPRDLPVLPPREGGTVLLPMRPAADAEARMAMLAGCGR